MEEQPNDPPKSSMTPEPPTIGPKTANEQDASSLATEDGSDLRGATDSDSANFEKAKELLVSLIAQNVLHRHPSIGQDALQRIREVVTDASVIEWMRVSKAALPAVQAFNAAARDEATGQK